MTSPSERGIEWEPYSATTAAPPLTVGRLPAGTADRSSGRSTARNLWIPMTRGEPATRRIRAAQILEMLVHYRLIEHAWRAGDDFGVRERSTRILDAEQVVDEFGDRLIEMVHRVQSESAKTTDVIPVPMDNPVPYIHDCTDRVEEYRRFWPNN